MGFLGVLVLEMLLKIPWGLLSLGIGIGTRKKGYSEQESEREALDRVPMSGVADVIVSLTLKEACDKEEKRINQ